MSGDRRPRLALLVGLFAPAGALIGHALVHALEAGAQGTRALSATAAGRWWAVAGAVALVVAASALWVLLRRATHRRRPGLSPSVDSVHGCARLWWRLAVAQLVLCGSASLAEGLVLAGRPLHAVVLSYAAFAQGLTALLAAATVRVVEALARRLCALPSSPWTPPLADPWQPTRRQPVQRWLRATVPLGLRAPPVSL